MGSRRVLAKLYGVIDRRMRRIQTCIPLVTAKSRLAQHPCCCYKNSTAAKSLSNPSELSGLIEITTTSSQKFIKPKLSKVFNFKIS